MLLSRSLIRSGVRPLNVGQFIDVVTQILPWQFIDNGDGTAGLTLPTAFNQPFAFVDNGDGTATITLPEDVDLPAFVLSFDPAQIGANGHPINLADGVAVGITNERNFDLAGLPDGVEKRYVVCSVASPAYAASIALPSEFTTDPAFALSAFEIGDLVSFDPGEASEGGSITLTAFTLDGEDKRAELSGNTWDSSGELAGAISATLVASNGTDPDDVVTITADLVEQVTLTITETAQGTATVDGATGIIDISIQSPAIYVGAYQANVDDLVNGPINVVAPAPNGTAQVGQELTKRDGIWINHTDNGAVAILTEWLKDDTVIATGDSFTPTSAQTGAGFAVRETATDTAGGVTATSATFSIAGAPGTIVTFLGGDVTGNTGGSNIETLSLPMGGHNGTDDVFVAVGAFSSSAARIASATLDGLGAKQVLDVSAASSGGTYVAGAVFDAQAFAAASSFVLTSTGQTWDAGAAAFAIPPGANVAELIAVPETERSGTALSADVSSGVALIAVQMTENGSQADWTGLDEIFEDDARTGEWASFAFASNVQAASPRVMAASGTSGKTSAVVFVISQ